jgi:hypothetical protein
VIVAAPTATAFTTPAEVTVATAGLDVDQLGIRPDKVFPFASLAVAVSWAVPPTEISADAGVTVTDATGIAFTVTVALPLFPSHVAVMTTTPGVTAVTRPVAETVATAALALAQVTVRPVISFPDAERSVSVSCTL